MEEVLKQMLNGEICKIKKVFLMLLSSCIHKNSTSNIEMTSDEWRKIINLARVHNVLPLVFEEASENESFISLPEYQQVAFETMSIVAGQARRTEEFLNLYSKLLKAGLYPIVMKGLVCRQLYGSIVITALQEMKTY